jgi:hypothetical protein
MLKAKQAIVSIKETCEKITMIFNDVYRFRVQGHSADSLCLLTIPTLKNSPAISNLVGDGVKVKLLGSFFAGIPCLDSLTRPSGAQGWKKEKNHDPHIFCNSGSGIRPRCPQRKIPWY